MLDKDSFTEGDSSSFKQWMLEQHPEIEYGPIDPAFDKIKKREDFHRKMW